MAWSSEKNKVYQKKYKQTINGRVNNIYSLTRNRAHRRCLDFDLDKEWIRKILTKGVCQVSDIPFNFESLEDRNSNPYAPSIDRKNNNKGYTKRNCQIILWSVNCLKGEMTMKEFKIFLKLMWEGMNND